MIPTIVTRPITRSITRPVPRESSEAAPTSGIGWMTIGSTFEVG